MKKKVLSLKVDEEELNWIELKYREFLVEKKLPWSRHYWMKQRIING